MLKLLLDEQISPAVAEGLRRHRNNATVLSLAEWEGGRFLGSSDEVLLREAANQNLTLVTYDRRTIPPLLKAWAEAGRVHKGVIFVDEKTISPSDLGALIRALRKLITATVDWQWENRVCFLTR
jgi:hypothetical protein